MKIYTLIYKRANFHANWRTWLFHGLSGTMCGSLHKISEKVISIKMGHGTYHQGVLKKEFPWDSLRGVERKIALKFECSSKECLKYRYFE